MYEECYALLKFSLTFYNSGAQNYYTFQWRPMDIDKNQGSRSPCAAGIQDQSLASWRTLLKRKEHQCVSVFPVYTNPECLSSLYLLIMHAILLESCKYGCFLGCPQTSLLPLVSFSLASVASLAFRLIFLIAVRNCPFPV